MSPHLYYPWHHHPAEEIYRILSGAAWFMKDGTQPVLLAAGDCYEHASNQPHAMETTDQPVMAYVVWRNGFETPPVLTTI